MSTADDLLRRYEDWQAKMYDLEVVLPIALARQLSDLHQNTAAYLQARTHDQGAEGPWRLDHDTHNPEGLPWAVEAPIGDGKLRRFGRFLRKDEAESLRGYLNALTAPAPDASQPATDELRALAEEVAVRIRGDAGFSPLYTNYDGATLEDQVAQDWLRRYDALTASQQQAGDAP
jgi:hypothetical protein